MIKRPKILDRRFVPAGTLIIEQGNIGSRAFLIESGKVEILKRDKKGRTVKIAEAGAGSIIGEMALIDGSERSASVKTLEESILIAISMKDIEESIGDPDGVFQKLMKVMVDRLKEMNDRMIRQNLELAELQEAAESTVENISFHIPEQQQTEFKKEMVPLLERLKETLSKYNHL